jgi:hypothetical protein
MSTGSARVKRLARRYEAGSTIRQLARLEGIHEDKMREILVLTGARIRKAGERG